MATLPIGYVASPYLRIDPAATPNRYRVLNRLSGRAFEGSGVLIDILRKLETEHSFQDLCRYFGEYSTEDIRKTLDFLAFRALVFRNDTIKGQLVQLTRTKETLFGFDDRRGTSEEGQAADFCIVGVPFGGGNPESNGSAHFPDAVRAYTSKYNLNLRPQELADFAPEMLDLSEAESNRLLRLLRREGVKDYGNIFVSLHESRRYVYEKITTVADRIFRSGHRPFFLGGDHSITYPILRAAADSYPDFYLIHVDAHTDTHQALYDKVQHDEKVHHHGNYVNHALALPQLKGVFQYGIRGVLNLLSRPTDERQVIVSSARLQRQLRQGGDDFPLPPPGAKVYLSVDIDVLDPGFAPGTATPVAHGLSPAELLSTLRSVLNGREVIGLDLVEVNPHKDREGLTVQLAAELLLPLIALAFTETPAPAKQQHPSHLQLMTN